MRLLALALFVVGCGSAGLPTDGGYTLTTTPATDSCTPRTRPIAEMETEVIAAGGTLTVGVPVLDRSGLTTGSLERYQLTDGKREVDDCVCGVTRHLSLELVDEAADTLAIRQTETWSSVAGAAPGCDALSGIPRDDCSVTVELRYRLVNTH